jgi:hypothetical protein
MQHSKSPVQPQSCNIQVTAKQPKIDGTPLSLRTRCFLPSCRRPAALLQTNFTGQHLLCSILQTYIHATKAYAEAMTCLSNQMHVRLCRHLSPSSAIRHGHCRQIQRIPGRRLRSAFCLRQASFCCCLVGYSTRMYSISGYQRHSRGFSPQSCRIKSPCHCGE